MFLRYYMRNIRNCELAHYSPLKTGMILNYKMTGELLYIAFPGHLFYPLAYEIFYSLLRRYQIFLRNILQRGLTPLSSIQKPSLPLSYFQLPILQKDTVLHSFCIQYIHCLCAAGCDNVI